MFNAVAFKLLLSVLLGGFIGLEREYHKDEAKEKKLTVSSLGVRTFSFLTLLGTMSGILFVHFQPVALLVLAGTFIMIVTNYVMSTFHTKDSGSTTELASIFAVAIGFFLALDVVPLHVTTALTVIATLILSRKAEIKQTVARLHKFETNSFIGFATIALVILPFLPNQPLRLVDIPFIQALLEAYNLNLGIYGTVELVNPYKLWFLVALITGVDMLGYFLTKFIGQHRGYVLSAITGGFVSSTATTISLAQESKRSSLTNKLVAAAIMANTASFFQLIVLLAPTSNQLLVTSTLPILSIIVAGVVSATFLMLGKEPKSTKTPRTKTQTQVFSLPQALKFAGLYLLVRIVSSVGLIIFGDSGVYLTSGLGALVGLDAVTLNLADLTTRHVLALQSGLVALMIANAVNLTAKVFYSYTQGSREFTYKLGASMAVIILVSLVTTGLIVIPK